MLKSRFSLLLQIISILAVCTQAQENRPLVPDQPVERKIAGGESHTNRVKLEAGEFMRAFLEQKGIDLRLSLASPDGKQLVVINLTRPGGIESLSAEPAASGEYRLTVSALAPAHVVGEYELRAERRAPSQEDRQRITAEGMLVEANPLVNQGHTAPRAIELLDKALLLWRTTGDRYWEANTLNLLGRAHHSINLEEKAIEYAEQGLALQRQVKSRAGQASALNTIGTSQSA